MVSSKSLPLTFIGSLAKPDIVRLLSLLEVTSGTVSFSLTRKNLHCPNSSALDPIHRAWNPIFPIHTTLKNIF